MTQIAAYVELSVYDQFLEFLQQYGGTVAEDATPEIVKGRRYCTIQFQYSGDLAAQHAFYVGLQLKTLHSDTDGAVAKLYRYNNLTEAWEFLYSKKTTGKLIAIIVGKENLKPQVEKCYRWECYNETGMYSGKIDTVNTSLF